MTLTPGRLRLLHGTDAPFADMRLLRAGPATVLLDGVDLRYLRIGGTELVRRIYAAVRDVDWDTVPGVVSGMEIEESSDGFRIDFDVRHARREVDFAWHGTITGAVSGRIEYVFDGWAGAAFPFGRIGLCVHHPWRETAGAWFTARTADGDIEGTFPDLIGPQSLDGAVYSPLFPSFDHLEVELTDGGRVVFDFEGDLWEIEDHRNWTDANFKTYSTPIGLGPPTPLEMGQVLRQRLLVTPVDVPAGTPLSGPVRLAIGPRTETVVPPIGLGQDRDRHVPDAHERKVLAALAPKHLRVELRLGSDWRSTLAAAQQSATAAGAHLEVSLHLLEMQAGELADVAAALARGAPVDRVLVINGDSRTATSAEATRSALVDLARGALAPSLPGAIFAGGTEIYFTEVNRARPDLSGWDGLCFSVTPQIHAFTDVDVVENLDAQGENVRSARAIAGAKPVIVSPITLRRRVNFHAAGDPKPTPPGELPDSVDMRQSSLYGAAWTTGSLKYMSESGASSVTYYESTGWRGVVERAGGSALPERFRSAAGEVFPLYHPLADVVEWHGADVLACESSDVLAAVGLAVRAPDGGSRVLVANLTPYEREVVVGPLHGGLSLRRLNESTAAQSASAPAAFRAISEVTSAEGELELTLAPYEVVRIDPA